MKIKKLYTYAFSSLVSVLIIAMGFSQHVYAANSQMYLSPAGGSYTSGQTFSVNVRVNAQSDINVIQANLSYPADKLEVSSISYAGSAFDIQAESTFGGGSIRIGRGVISTFSGDRLVATVIFSVRSNSGTATVSFSGGSLIANNGVEEPTTKGGGSYTFYAPSPTPSAPKPTTPTATNPNAPSTQTTQPVVPTVDTVKPEIIESTVVGSSLEDLFFTLKTNEPTQIKVDYGFSKNYGFVAQSANSAEDHKLALEQKFLLPKTTYYYKVSLTDASGNVTQSEEKTFTTAGLPYKFVALDDKNNPLKGVEITIDGETKVSNDLGEVTFELNLGSKTAVFQTNKKTTLYSFVLGADTVQAQPQTVTINKSTNLDIFKLLGGLLIPLFILAFFLIFAHKESPFVRTKMSYILGILSKPVKILRTTATKVKSTTKTRATKPIHNRIPVDSSHINLNATSSDSDRINQPDHEDKEPNIEATSKKTVSSTDRVIDATEQNNELKK